MTLKRAESLRKRSERQTLKNSNALSAALRLLARREHSETELAGRLKRKGFVDADIAAALERCRELGYMDDARFALERTRSLMRNGRAVGHRILADLKGRGVSENDALAALEQAALEFDGRTLLADLHRRRFPDFSYGNADERQRRRVVNFFLRRGFSLSQVMSFLKEER